MKQVLKIESVSCWEQIGSRLLRTIGFVRTRRCQSGKHRHLVAGYSITPLVKSPINGSDCDCYTRTENRDILHKETFFVKRHSSESKDVKKLPSHMTRPTSRHVTRATVLLAVVGGVVSCDPQGCSRIRTAVPSPEGADNMLDNICSNKPTPGLSVLLSTRPAGRIRPPVGG